MDQGESEEEDISTSCITQFSNGFHQYKYCSRTDRRETVNTLIGDRRQQYKYYCNASKDIDKSLFVKYGKICSITTN